MTLETRGPPSNPSVSNAKKSTIFVGEFCVCYRNEGDFEGNIHLTGNHLSQRIPRTINHQHTAHDYLSVGSSVRYNIPKKIQFLGLFYWWQFSKFLFFHSSKEWQQLSVILFSQNLTIWSTSKHTSAKGESRLGQKSLTLWHRLIYAIYFSVVN